MKFFNINEFSCPCCGQNPMRQDFLDKIDKAREYANVPFHISSGFRCLNHNRQIGSLDTSSHLRGLAADIVVRSSRLRYEILMGLWKAGFNRFGIASKFIHVDNDKDKPSNVIWTY